MALRRCIQAKGITQALCRLPEAHHLPMHAEEKDVAREASNPPGSWHPAAPVAPAPQSIEQVLPRAHDAINTAVWEAVQEVQRDFELGSNESKLTKRLSNYIYKAVSSPELMAYPCFPSCR